MLLAKIHCGFCFASSHTVTANIIITIFDEGEVEEGGNQHRKHAGGVVDLATLAGEPAILCLVVQLIEAAIHACHEDTAIVVTLYA